MSEPPPARTRAQEEAAQWLARLGHHPISTQAIRDFRDWRDDPANDTAYEEAEAFWEASGQHAADPGILAMTEQALARGKRRPLWTTWLRRPATAATGLALAAAAGVALTIAVNDRLNPAYATQPIEQKVVRLADGSRVHLNVDSRIRVRFTDEGRHIELAKGEAYFEVAHDAVRPFTVAAGQTQVRALGTKFDVRRGRDQTQVTLLQGSVRVSDPAQPEAVTLAPNQQATIARARPIRTAAADAQQTTSWTTGRLTFRDQPLAAAIAEVNRYTDRPVELADPALGTRPLSGFFDVGDPQSFARGVALLFDLQVTPGTDGGYRLSHRPARPAPAPTLAPAA